ncbi:MAG: hypothetical protein AB9869_03910 [Verrucomicrobiia bacterium]
MRDVIQSVVEAEAEARRMIQSAREEADRILAEAQEQVQRTLPQARAEGRAASEKVIQTAVQRALEQKAELLRNAEIEIRESTRIDPALKERIIDAVVQCVRGERRGGTAPRQVRGANPSRPTL